MRGYKGLQRFLPMMKLHPATSGDIVALGCTINTAVVALIASMIQQQKPEQSYAKCVIQAIERLAAVDVPNPQL